MAQTGVCGILRGLQNWSKAVWVTILRFRRDAAAPRQNLGTAGFLAAMELQVHVACILSASDERQRLHSGFKLPARLRIPKGTAIAGASSLQVSFHCKPAPFQPHPRKSRLILRDVVDSERGCCACLRGGCFGGQHGGQSLAGGAGRCC